MVFPIVLDIGNKLFGDTEDSVVLKLVDHKVLDSGTLILGVLLVALIPVALAIPALATITVLAALLIVLIVIEERSCGEARDRVRHEYRET